MGAERGDGAEVARPAGPAGRVRLPVDEPDGAPAAAPGADGAATAGRGQGWSLQAIGIGVLMLALMVIALLILLWFAIRI
ncbi:MAG TPA: hypothetical protein VFW96_23430 [Thermomicrobiales bacterium]|nr:hypothetical protein [Thermomicrobiales bacterium]